MGLKIYFKEISLGDYLIVGDEDLGEDPGFWNPSTPS